MKKLLSALLIGLGLVGLYFWTSRPPAPQMLHIQVSVVNEKTNVFQHVFQDQKRFDYDETTKNHKLCIGETSPLTDHSVCHIENGSVQVFHFTGEVPKPSFTLCLYVSKDKADCRVGNDKSEFYSESEL